MVVVLKSVRPFDPSLEVACHQFEQGHLLLNPFTVYVARPDVVASNWAKDFAFSDPAATLAVGGIAPGPEPPFFIILDQTCDVQKTNIPFLHVSPVYNGAKYYEVGSIQRVRDRRAFGYLYALTASNLEDLLTDVQREEQARSSAPGEWAWLADLRIQVPLDKGVLLDREVIAGFASREDQLALGRELGNRADRPALPTVATDYVIPALVRAVREAEELLRGVQFRLIADSISNPSWLELVLITPHSLASAESVREHIGRVVESVGMDIGIPCTVRSCGTDVQVSAADYRDSDLIDIDLAPDA
jgi:hypothetical protein